LKRLAVPGRSELQLAQAVAHVVLPVSGDRYPLLPGGGISEAEFRRPVTALFPALITSSKV